MISVEGLSVEFNATPLFEDVSYVINKKDRIALVGKNGAGKSTMLKILAGLQSPTHGVVATPKDVTIGYLPQVMILADNRTVMGEAELAFEHIFELQARLERMNRELAERTDYESEEYHQLIDRFTHENDRFLMMGGTNYQAEIERTLLGLGFSREDFERPTSEFSGGWRMRIELAKLLLRRPDVLLLDEPTNHLDITSKEILERALNDYTGTILYVSHDRYFINQTATRILELTGNTFVNYIGNYDYYLEKKDLLTPAVSTAASEDAPAQVSESKLSWQEQKEEQARLRKRQNDLKKTEERIGVLETRNGKIDELMMQEEVYTNSVKCQELAKEKAANEAELEELYEKWEELAE